MKQNINININIIGIIALIIFALFSVPYIADFMAIGDSANVNIKIFGMDDRPLGAVEIRTDYDSLPIRISGTDGTINNLKSSVYYLATPPQSSGYGVVQLHFAEGGEYTVKYVGVETISITRLGDIPPIDTGGDTGTGDDTGTGTGDTTADGNMFDRHPAFNSGVLWGIGGFIVTWIGIVALIAAGVISAPGAAVLLALAAIGGLVSALYGAISNIEVPNNPDAGFWEKVAQLPSALYDGAKEETGIIVDKVTETIVTTYTTVTESVSSNLAEALEKLIAGDISGALSPLITVLMIFVLIGITVFLLYIGVKTVSEKLSGVE